LEQNIPDIICFVVFGAVQYIALFRPNLIKDMQSSVSIGPFSRRIQKPMSRFTVMCFGLLWGIVGLGVLLRNCGAIADNQVVPIFFVSGFVVAGIGVIYQIIYRPEKHPK
ncbi:MAG TPA: hypothetical protein VN625_00440, partial [Desulfuromonadaceae bacterium]|nr:hypothetical protein [Desulfuromonadaceae bacterium]